MSDQPKSRSIVSEMHWVIDTIRVMVAREEKSDGSRQTIPHQVRQTLRLCSRRERLQFLEAMALEINGLEIEAEEAARGAKP